MKTVFLHIPKCAGTSLYTELRDQFGRDRVFIDYDNPLEQFDCDYLDGFSFFSGHWNMKELNHIRGEKRIITMLRNPTNRVLSTYHYWRAADVDLPWLNLARELKLKDFLNHPMPEIQQAIDNTQVRFLAGLTPPKEGDMGSAALKQAQRALASIAFGTVETGPPSGFGLTLKQRENSTGASKEFPEDAAEAMERVTKWDWELYRWATAGLI